MPKYNMPQIALDELRMEMTVQDFQIVKRIVNSRTGALRASKPLIEYQRITENGLQYDRPQEPSGSAAYVWRMVAFACSPNPQHHCMPVMAFCDVPGTYDESKERAKELDILADKIIDSIPVTQWHGIRRWANTGLIG